MKRIFALYMALTLVCGVSEARKASGVVTSGKERLAGVIVTDGKNFTSTDRKGRFSFDIEDNAEFVYIVTPSGYAADWSSGVPAFYQQAEGKSKFTFDLKRLGQADDYSIIAIADPQTRGDKHFAKFIAAPLDDVCATAGKQEQVAVGLTLGDISWDTLHMLPKYKAEIVRTGIPFYPVVGNHDHDKEASGDYETTAAYRREMGPENYAFRMGKDVVIVVDNIIYRTQKKYDEGYAPHVLEFVKGIVSLLPQDADIYIAQHASLYLWDKDRTALNSDELLEILKGHNVNFVSGHTHINNFYEYAENVVEHNVAAICGSWWDTVHCTDGTPRGYKVFTVKDGSLSWYYKSVDYPEDYQVQVFGKGESDLFPESILVNVWDWDPQWKVEWFEDGVAKGELQTVLALSPIYVKDINAVYASLGEEMPKYKKPRKNFHYFAATPSESAAKVKVRVTSRFGQVWEYEVECK